MPKKKDPIYEMRLAGLYVQGTKVRSKTNSEYVKNYTKKDNTKVQGYLRRKKSR
jgi:hypothetical protein